MKKVKVFYNIIKGIVCVTLAIVLVTILYGCKSKSLIKRASKNLNSYTINATYCDEEHTVNATEKVKYTNKTGNILNFVCFNLYGTAFSADAVILPYTTLNAKKCFPNGLSYGDLEIISVRVDEEDADFNIVGQDNNALQINFKNSLNNNESTEIEIVFKLTLANCTHRLGYFDGYINLGNWYPIIAVYENGEFDITPYYSSGDPFYSECANYNLTFNYPDKMVLGSTGQVVNSSSANGVKTVTIEAKAVRDFALILSDKFQKISSKIDDTVVNYYFYKDQNSQKSLQTSVNALKTFSSLFGKYPYSNLSVCESNFVYGGMEYPNLVFISDDLENYEDYTYTIVHEIAHQWWYGMVGNNEYKFGFLDEGLTEYSTYLFFDENPEYELNSKEMVKNTTNSYLLFLDVYKEVFTKVDTSMIRSLNEFSTEPEYVYISYVKSVLMFDNLKDIVGKINFLKSLRYYFNQNAGKNATPDKLILAFNKICKQNLESYFNSWFNGSVVIENL